MPQITNARRASSADGHRSNRRPQRPRRRRSSLESESLAEALAARCKRAIVQPRPQRSRRRFRRTRAPMPHWLARLIATRAPRSRTALDVRPRADDSSICGARCGRACRRRRDRRVAQTRLSFAQSAFRRADRREPLDERARTRCSAVCVRAVPAARYAASAFVFQHGDSARSPRDLRRGRRLAISERRGVEARASVQAWSTFVRTFRLAPQRSHLCDRRKRRPRCRRFARTGAARCARSRVAARALRWVNPHAGASRFYAHGARDASGPSIS